MHRSRRATGKQRRGKHGRAFLYSLSQKGMGDGPAGGISYSEYFQQVDSVNTASVGTLQVLGQSEELTG